MDTVHTGSIGAVHGEHTKEAQAFSTTTNTTNDHHKQPLDAGALFVLKSKDFKLNFYDLEHGCSQFGLKP
ncbi:hypothetical protein HanXRQr2_Chr13g0580731 [Helianthus annuus]|uniref:Uncharacterized protein n=1 Tax=Helianthus annuus TaxID=4232 RepID=A0A9K3EF59_HELAN|nr:hypothetical protein HanXRQr2_Chr13g0580731 [Helianthus annuus]KAJ0848558.1 hypothetical protein HanPSC8_Chr13g0558881 [Helianthus annuus]